jgi:hypothetical protein
LSTQGVSSATTAEVSLHYLVDTSSAAFAITLPAGAEGSVIRFTDATDTWGDNPLTITPATGEAIDGQAANETLVLDVQSTWVQFMWDNDAGQWVTDTIFAANAVPFPNGTVRLDTGLGHGSTGTKIRTFTNSSIVGDAFTYTADTTDGDYITVNRDCIASVLYQDRNSSGITQIGVTVNADGTDRTTNVVSIADFAVKLAVKETAVAGVREQVVLPSFKFSKGDIIRAHTSGTPNEGSLNCFLRVQEIYRLGN